MYQGYPSSPSPRGTRCSICDSTAVFIGDTCSSCNMSIRRDLNLGFPKLEAYLTKWAAFREWEGGT
jgi:hypothetical protein